MYLQEKPTKMSEKRSLIAHRAWSLLRLALLWARKGGLFRNRLVVTLNVLGKEIRKLLQPNHSGGGALAYGDREFSFDATPIVHVQMYRPSSSMRFKMPRIPCINPHVDFECDFEGDYTEEEDGEELSEEIDLKAEKFIAKFYEQMKLQRQKSYQKYN